LPVVVVAVPFWLRLVCCCCLVVWFVDLPGFGLRVTFTLRLLRLLLVCWFTLLVAVTLRFTALRLPCRFAPTPVVGTCPFYYGFVTFATFIYVTFTYVVGCYGSLLRWLRRWLVAFALRLLPFVTVPVYPCRLIWVVVFGCLFVGWLLVWLITVCYALTFTFVVVVTRLLVTHVGSVDVVVVVVVVGRCCLYGLRCWCWLFTLR